MPLFLYIYSHIHSYNHLLITFAEALLYIFIAAGGAKPRFELTLPTSKPAHYHLSYAAHRTYRRLSVVDRKVVVALTS